MINPYDLSPGSWANCDGIGPCKIVVLALRMEGIESYYLLNGIKDEHWQGIPLTPELMDKLRWTTSEGPFGLVAHQSPGERLFVVFQNEGGVGFIWGGGATVGIRFLHELQNAYRWTTGKHLEAEL